MPFDPTDFLSIAERLFRDEEYKEIEEARARTVIGRAYYATFLSVRELLGRELSRDPEVFKKYSKIAETGMIHSCIRDTLNALDYILGQFFDRLNMLRRRSDYNLESEIKDKVAEEALSLAKEIASKHHDITVSTRNQFQKVSSIVENFYQRLTRRRASHSRGNKDYMSLHY